MEDPIKRLDYAIAVLKGERENRRQDARVKTIRRCRIIFGEQAKAMRGFLIDLSKSGARLRPADATNLPDGFKLEIEHDLKIGCKVVHRCDNELGVSFNFDT
jgi:c-di-GMP-binding flagellar brake protein YcgR